MFNYSAGRTELQIIFTETAFSFTSLRDCIRFECACAVCFLNNLCNAQKGADSLHRDSGLRMRVCVIVCVWMSL